MMHTRSVISVIFSVFLLMGATVPVAAAGQVLETRGIINPESPQSDGACGYGSTVTLAYVSPNPAEANYDTVHAHVDWSCNTAIWNSQDVYLNWGDGHTDVYVCGANCGSGVTDFYHDPTTPINKTSYYKVQAYMYNTQGGKIYSNLITLTVYWVCCIANNW